VTPAPLVSVVVVNYNGEAYLRALLPTLFAQTHPRVEIVVVDNASTDGSLGFLSELEGRVRVIRSRRNLGFAGGNNLGVRSSDGVYVALLNSDTVVEPDWLQQLVVAIESDSRVAAVGSKITFLRPFLRFTLQCVAPAGAAGRVEPDAQCELRIDETTRIEGCGYHKPLFGGGFGPRRNEGGRVVRYLSGRSELSLPFDGEGDRVLRVVAATAGACPEARLRVELGGHAVGEARLGGGFTELSFSLPGEDVSRYGRYVINNAGSFLDARGVAGDRGIFEPDEGQYDSVEDVQALCGCAMLVRRSAFEAVGGFDPAFFMYFEDVDLCWRLRRRGHRLLYQPGAVVRHVHAGTSTEGSPLFVLCTGRNRLLMLTKNAPWSAVAAMWWWELRYTAGLLKASLRASAGDPGRASAREGLRLRLRILAGALRRAPGALLARWRG